jgi:dihydroxyacetone kinase-like predicted kinase
MNKGESIMLEYKFDTQLLIAGKNLSEDTINEYITNNIDGDCLLAVGDDELIKIHFHTNTPWSVLEYCSSLGEIHDIVVENMERQSDGLQG